MVGCRLKGTGSRVVVHWPIPFHLTRPHLIPSHRIRIGIGKREIYLSNRSTQRATVGHLLFGILAIHSNSFARGKKPREVKRDHSKPEPRDRPDSIRSCSFKIGFFLLITITQSQCRHYIATYAE